MTGLYIIKAGGNVIDDPLLLEKFLADFNALAGAKILIHGGGKLATELAEKLNVPQTLIDGRRITDAETLKIAAMVYAGLINKTLVAKLQALGCNALGLSGADGNLLKTALRNKDGVDYGFVGDLTEDSVNTELLHHFVNKGFVPVLCAITHDGEGSLLNTNADAIARALAVAMNKRYNVSLTYCFEKNGVLLNPDKPETVIPDLNKEKYAGLKNNGIVSKGMIPKLDMAFEALAGGVQQVRICHASALSNKTGTSISNHG